ncbi:hypothetical protein ANO11243_034790 [Dothideomycetidae sp. 11243]|nr:hypothetical protein ANO11243_034790 [fungal sp. No.11243]
MATERAIAAHDGAQQLEEVDAMDVFDPKQDDVRPFSDADEKRYIRKIDLWIVPLMMVTYFLQSYDKGILSAATQFGIETDLGLIKVIGHTKSGAPITSSVKYSNASSIFYVGYLIGTLPMTLLTQRFPVSRVIGGSVFLWGVVTMCIAGCTDYSGLMAARFFLGVLESAVAPTFIVLVTFWWSREEQVWRNGLWYSCVGLATTVSPMTNYGLGRVHTSLAPWKFMFLLLGAITICWSAVLVIFLPDSPFECKRLTDRERAISLYRLKKNNAGTIHRAFERSQLIEALMDYKLWSAFLIIFLTGVPSSALGTFGTLVIKSFGYDSEVSLALTSPIGAITCLTVLLSTYIPRHIRNIRYVFIMISASISIVGCGICWLDQSASKAVLWFGVFLISVQVAAGGLAVSTSTTNTSGHTKKSTVSAITFIGYCLGNITGPKLFGDSPAPAYHDGFLGSFICLCLVVVIAAATLAALTMKNKKRDRETGGRLNEYSINDDVTDWENKDFRYVL